MAGPKTKQCLAQDPKLEFATDSALVAEAKRRIQKASPIITDAQITLWLAYVAAHGGRLVLTFDGSVYAEYPKHPAAHADS